MTAAAYLEHYLDSLESLPIELQRNFSLMRDLDQRAQSMLRDIDEMSNEFIKNSLNVPGDKKKETIEKIQKQYGKARELGDDKVQLAIQTYELVDKHIRKLDSDLARFESEIKDRAKANKKEEEVPVTQKGRKKTADREKKKKGRVSRAEAMSEDEELIPISQKKKGKKGGTAAAAVDGVALSLAHPADVLDMPVDPNEPTYCLCHQVSYGEMIGCDNPDVSVFLCLAVLTYFYLVFLISLPYSSLFLFQ
ncbi:hypothetical protein QYM36_007125 [Artemia franciscana]|uniref:Inhibitor of growth protein N-terminal histone-binding domain-containing protein n=1 Tax=Artemia franciscana TaxID=6661 RepID=A0AA88HW11_ARTSF|nr:hypothetical protein QYM36_007125 [Artemia franciscana]